MSIIDLHIHSNFSDGSDSLEEIFNMAKKLNIKTLAITDHDTIKGIPTAMELSKNTILI